MYVTKRFNNIGQSSPNFDLEPCDLDDSVITRATNYIIRDGKYITFNNQEQAFVAPSSFNAGYMDFVQNANQNFYLVAGRNAVKVYDGSAWTDVSNLTAYGHVAGDELNWTGCKIGQIPVLANSVGYPEYWSPMSTSTKMQDLKFDAATTWRAKGYKCKIIRNHLNFLFALNLTEGATELPNAYRWSHPADINGLPFSWDELDLSTIASKEMVGDEFILDGMSLRDSFCIYTNRGIHILDYLGDSEFVFRRRVLSKTHNIIATDCVAEVLGDNYFLSNGDILVNDGNQIYSILDQRMKRFLESSLSSTNYKNCFVKVNPIRKEIWFFIVQSGFTYPNLAIIVNYNDNNKISLRDIAGTKTSAAFGSTSIPADAWDSDALLWSSDGQPWNLGSSPFNYGIVAVDNSTSTVYNQESTKQSGLGNYNTVLERISMPLTGHEDCETIVRMYPHIKSNGSVLIELGSQDHVRAPIRWKPGVVFTPSIMRKVDIRTTGMLHAWRVSSIADSHFEMSGMDIQYVPSGGRVGGAIPAISR
jgi:hypothetical protein